MAATVARGSQMNSVYIKPILRKAYHKKGGSDIISDAVKINGEEVKSIVGDNCDRVLWVPDNRTGIYYPKGQEKVIQEVPASKEHVINWFSNHEINQFN